MFRELQVVTLLGSLYKGSFNGMIARTLPKTTPASMEINALSSVAGIPLYDIDVQQEDSFPTTVEILAKQIRQADSVVIVTPECNYLVLGGLKNAADWFPRPPDQPLASKPALIWTSSMGMIGGVRRQYRLHQILVLLDTVVVNKPEFMGGVVQNKADP